ncbi:uncharacterized protein FOBCDRAFT_241815 [Fusarium oxysporum Fo47]|uniref:uncharacterized protein n=1 Tax=Fusarium oxysporum Fo47 TaxID=660027 RepID=UPI002869CCFB|nr:uncharacterized protein FOBCDRAFT_241815 [Fusarium oxysporum Fo47]QJS76576.2 hypothetical protein FOBCDRAFT_241815 [Fusarium oxysporum Fo47]
MNHVVAWLNAISTMIFHRRDNNKPPLRADPAATLKHHSDQMSGRLRRAPEAAPILLPLEVLDFLVKHLDDFRNPAVKLYLDQAPKEIDYA